MLPGLKLIINYNRIVGITFFGLTYHGEKLNNRMIWLLRLWNVIVISIIAIFGLTSFRMTMEFNITNSTNSNNVTSDTTSSRKVDLVYSLVILANILHSVQSIITALYLVIFGPKIINLLLQLERFRIDSTVEYKIAKNALIMQILWSSLSAIFSIMFALIMHLDLYYYVIPFAICIFIETSTQLTILSLIFYVSMVMKNYLANITNSSLETIQIVICKLDKLTSDLDKYISMYIMTSLLFKQIFCMSTICQIALVYNKKTIIDSILFSYVILNLLIICYICNIIPKSISRLISKLERNPSQYSCNILNKITIMQLRQLSDRIGFTAFGLFRVNANTFVSCLGLIITYSVIVIQTGSQ